LERGLDFAGLWSTYEDLLRGSRSADVLDFGVLLPSCEAIRSARKERRVWQLLAGGAPLRRDMQEIIAGATGHARNPEAYIDKQTVGEDLPGAQVARHGGHAQHKLAMLVQHVEAVLCRGPGVAADILQAVVEFSKKKYNYWLKVAADRKAELINDVLSQASLADHRLRLELGAYVGFSGLRLAGGAAREVASQEEGAPKWGVRSLEVEPLHVCVARHMLNLGERGHLAEVRAGQVRDLLPRLVDELGESSVGLTFMDHRGTRFHDELCLFERMRLPANHMDTICDNVLHPGAPVFLWEESRPGARRRAAIWSLPEFGGEGQIEDWMALERYVPQGDRR